jgi:phospholipase/carboxylesterase
MPLVTTQLGPLSCRVFQQGAAPPELAVVMCHGFGAPGEDLVPLAAELVRRRSELEHTRFVFPAASLSLASLGPGYGAGRAWWMLDMERLMSIQMGGSAGEAAAAFRAEVPEGLALARRQLLALIDELSRTTGLPRSKLVLSGFSQGGMLATDVALRMEEAPAALGILSGTLLSEKEWTARAAARKGLRVFQSHGRQDPILPYDNAEALRDMLRGAGLEVEFLPFDGEHGIPLEAVEGLAALIASARKA